MEPRVFSKKTSFISIEVSIKSSQETPHFIEWFESQDNYVWNTKDESGRWFVYCDPIMGASIDSVVQDLCAEVDRFPAKVREEWDKSDERFFDIGFNGGEEPHFYTQQISYKNLQDVIRVGAYIKVSIYPAEPSDEEGIPKSFYQEE